ncbi:holin family protein [Roseovarius nubinhibens]|uniref:Carboxylesterase n=1 Tax=Roseovarius nubinhibens TaxID=314263 RepID=A0A348WF38_9RHOB|nr:carboxylesterase [Roseovarius nubinhibens]
MGLMAEILRLIFGNGRNVIAETAEVFRENAEAGSLREASLRAAALEQFGAEFAHPERSRFDRVMDGLNRVPRPAMALGTLGLFIAAMVDPLWFAARMQGIALVPEPLWWLLGVIVSFYFGARHQQKTQEFQRALSATMARAPGVVQRIEYLQSGRAEKPGQAAAAHDAEVALEAVRSEDNPALEAWRRTAHHGPRQGRER